MRNSAEAIIIVYDPVRTFHSGESAPVRPGIVALTDPWTASGGSSSSYYHGELIDTTRSVSNPDGAGGTIDVYTAFSERINTSRVDETNRYGYAGAWGYQAHEEFPFLHVGARYYDPATGRFLQRDPIGIGGGLNVYCYSSGHPANTVDPFGLTVIEVNGQPIPDPDGPGDVYDKRQEYYRFRMRQFGWGGCSMIDFLNPKNIWKFIEHTAITHAEAMEFYPDPKPNPKPDDTDQPFKPRPPVQPPVYCNRCH